MKIKFCQRPDFLKFSFCQIRGLVRTLKVIEGTVTSQKYVRLLSTCLLQDGQKLIGQNFEFQQDNALPHTAFATWRWFERKNIKVIEMARPNSGSQSN